MRALTFAAARDFTLLVGGLVLIGYETLIPAEPRTALIALAAVMMGLPATFVADRWLIGKPPPPPEPTPEPQSSESGPTT